MSDLMWWRGAVIYQIYPRSFNDSTGNGIGDLNGISEKLEYIASLGVDAIWISPVFCSPMHDFGYDVSNYRDIDPLFGSIADFDNLLEKSHQLKLKVMIDLVASHTSMEHPWFKESKENKINDKADWYVWADPKEDGTPPNNWLSIFGGSAWEWESRRQQYYLNNFSAEQPDLNYHNDAVRKQILQEAEFWLKRGVDGFRMDAINFCYHDRNLTNNPSKPIELRRGLGFGVDNPYAYQVHQYDNTQPEIEVFLNEVRALMNSYPGTVALGEVSSENSIKTMTEYSTGNDRLHMVYSFELLVDDFSGNFIKSVIGLYEEGAGDSWPCWSVGNHDVKRVVSRWGNAEPSQEFAKMINGLLFSLRGSICSYQGEELGLPEAVVNFESLQDPFGKKFWPKFVGRDGCRTPMPWKGKAINAGFSTEKPWLPIDNNHYNYAVDIQESNPNSVLNAYRQFLAWRKEQPILKYGDIEFVIANNNVLAFIRKLNGQAIFMCFNLSNQAIEVSDLPFMKLESLQGHSFSGAENKRISSGKNNISLPAFGAFFATIIKEE